MKATQYAKSTAPEVIATIEENERSRQAWIDDTKTWFDKTVLPSIPGAKLFLFSTRTTIGLSGIVTSDEKKPAGWKFSYQSRFEPRKDNPLRAEWDARRWQAASIPGLPVFLMSFAPVEHQSWWRMYPSPFISNGAAWLNLEHMPDPDSPNFGPQWTEVRASQAMAAWEALKVAA